MKGVLMLVNEFPPHPGSYGAERQAERLSVYMAKRELKVGVITRHFSDVPYMENRDGFLVIRIPQFGPGKFKTLTFTIGAILAIFRYRHMYDVLHAHLAYSPAVAATIAGKLLGKPVMVLFGNTGAFGDVQNFSVTWRGKIAARILRKWVDMYISLSVMMEKEMLDAGFDPSKVICMENGVDTADIRPPANKKQAKESIGVKDDRILVLFTGRLTKQKAQDVLFHAFQKALQVSPNLHLMLVGDGEDRKKLEMLAEDLKIALRITFVGRVEDVRPYLSAADIFVLPSLAEGLSNSLLEAMSMGLPCIASRVSGSVDVLGEGDERGLLIAPGNIEQLADAMVRLASNPAWASRMGLLARERIIEKYDMFTVVDKYISLYRRLCGEV